MNHGNTKVCSDRVPDEQEISELRAVHYNAAVVGRIDIHDDLARFQIRPDRGVPRFAPGQYVALGLGYWERRLPGTQAETLPAKKHWRMVRRAYSISCPLVDASEALVTCDDIDFLEFYVTLIRTAEEPPALTPRLFALHPGDRLFVQPRVVGTYTLEGIAPHENVLLLGTGTGEAPHNAMAAALLKQGHQGRIAVACCARLADDLGYTRAHDVLMNRYANYRYLPYTTREPRNLDSSRGDYVGNERLQTVYRSGRLESEAGFAIDPRTTHVFLCGNPLMIGLRRGSDPPLLEPGMLQLLLSDGFREEGEAGPGLVRYEKYW
ncbi:ferredoxin reductase domain-containing protein [Candidatus Laterigemmans baculatus]|uniref:ferredoxin--NADP reductase n=1 Tax=Candidatus Laterigemmans baculatus TaxID=2770505 RepID=UPI0013D93177|nr:ferredoxin--NADP reductase [Candidatus Laterigemmans baculatus]